jgi:non-specific serine/threonine protein kinase
LFGNEIPVAKEYLKALIVLPPLWCSTGTTKLESLRLILESSICGTRSKLISKKLEKYDLIFTSYAVLARDLSILESTNFVFDFGRKSIHQK